jgi:tetratricopeptide (TPR) repeat protein
LASALNTSDPELLQAQAVQTVESFKSHAYRTGDLISMLPAMRIAHNDLDASYQALIAKGDLAAAALSMRTMADIERMTAITSSASQHSAAEKHRQAIELSKQANRTDYEFKALGGLAQAESNQNDLASASQHATQALDLAVASGNKSFLLEALDRLSEIEVKRQNLAAARVYLERAQTVAAELPDSVELYLYHVDRRELYYRLGSQCDLSKAEECSHWFDLSRSANQAAAAVAVNLQFDFYVQMAKGFLQDLDRQLVLRARQFAFDARIFQKLGNSQAAESLLRQALAIQGKSLEPDDPTLIDTLVPLADLLASSNKTDEAEQFYRRALLITEKASGRETPRAAEIRTSLSLVYLKRPDYAETERLLLEAAAIQSHLQGADQSSVATTMSALGSLYLAEGKYDQAEPCYQRSLAIRRKAFGSNSAVTANSLTDLAALYYHLGQYGKAQTYYESALRALAGPGRRPY